MPRVAYSEKDTRATRTTIGAESITKNIGIEIMNADQGQDLADEVLLIR